MKRIFCFGDSNVFGYIPQNGGRYDKNTRWTGVLQSISDDKFEIIEAGCNNRTAFSRNPDGIMYTGCDIFPQLLSKDLDCVILAAGINDLQPFYNNSFADIRNGIERLIDIIRSKCPRAVIILAAPSVLTDDILRGNFSCLFDESSIEKSFQMANIYSEAARLKECEFINFEDIARVSYLDGLHYDAMAHRKIAEAVFEKLKEVL